ncbi:MAG TPA: rhodanese-like domain-containing protein [Actinomycetota bacterium]|nr:rhodanese-like domain-containing protein [Actinomycetota bacterium]
MSQERIEDAISTSRGLHGRIGDVQVLDVREADEWAAGHIEGSVHLPLSRLMSGPADLDPERPVVAVCSMGSRSEVAMLMLRARGFVAYNLERGLQEWFAEGLPLVSDDGRPPRVA